MTQEGLRRDALTILRDALAGVDPVRLVSGALVDEPELTAWVPAMALESGPAAVSSAGTRGSSGRTMLVAVGKAALGMTRGAFQVLGDAVDGGVVLVPHGTTGEVPGDEVARGGGGVPGPPERPSWLPPRIALRSGGHPVPDESGRRAAEEISDMVGSLEADDRLLVLLSGGGSALLTLPRPGLPLAAIQETTAILLEAGLTIEELNQVRTLLEVLKGGGLARRAGAARILGLVLSDVVGNDPAVIASGPLSPRDPTGRDVQVMLRRRGVWERLPIAVRDLIRGDDGDGAGDAGGTGSRPAVLRDPVIRVVGTGITALQAAESSARRLGYDTRILTSRLQGEARRAGRGLARVGRAVVEGVSKANLPACILASGETTVEVRGRGRGGRNQEVALGAAVGLDGCPGVLVASLGTDGVDGPTDAAGAIADGETVSRARAAGLDVEASLRANDAYPLLDALGDLIRTGPTGTNVADLMVVLVSDGYRRRSP
jgi:glycerate 2-kinase